jgi:hypothetical protein
MYLIENPVAQAISILSGEANEYLRDLGYIEQIISATVSLPDRFFPEMPIIICCSFFVFNVKIY